MIVHKPSGKLILNLREPGRVTTVIPTSSAMQFKGENLVVVPHREDEVRVLRNLGFDPPSPITTYYDWPGQFEPYAHQRSTAEFLTLNPWAFCLNGMGCIEGDAKVRVSRKRKSYETDLRTLHRKFHTLPDKETWKARSLKGEMFGMNQLLDVLYKGEQPTLRITLADGKVFRCTPDHQLAQAGGAWIEAGKLAVGGHLVTNGTYSITCGGCGVPRARKSPLRRPGQVCNKCRHKAHSARMQGENNPSWAGGRFVDSDGYVRISLPEHHRADSNGFVYEHIVVAEGVLGEPIYADRHVHHKNEDKADNAPSNLEVMSAGDHHRGHSPRAKLDGARSGKGGVVVVLPKTALVVSIEPGGVTDVYDLCMEAPHHNFVVNGVVVHNSGKTMSVLWAFDYLRGRGLARKMLVVAPLSTLTRTWADEAFTHFPEMRVNVLYGAMERRLKLLALDADVYVINHDAIKSREMLAALAARRDIDIVVIDEVAAFRTAGTARFKSAKKLVKGRTYVWGLTGTPTPNGPTDAWAQCQLITPHTVPAYFGAFRDRVMKQVSTFKWVPRDDALAAVRDAMQPAIRFSRQDCIDLPPTTYQTRTAPLTPEQKAAFDSMVKAFKAEYAGGQVLAVNEAVKLGKLVQICCLRAGTEVLTEAGWCKIEKVSSNVRVWDGVEWVRHLGAVRKGFRQTIEVGGVSMTPDHLVLSRAGWVTAQEMKDGAPSNKLDWAEVRLPYRARESGARPAWLRALGVRLRMRVDSCAQEPVPAEAAWGSALRMLPREHQTRSRPVSPVQHLGAHAREVPKPEVPRLPALWRAGRDGVRCLGRLVRCFLGRHGHGLFGSAFAGPEEQRPRVLPRELPVGDSGPASAKQAPATTRGTAGALGRYRSTAIDAVRSEEAWRALDPVFDLVECGPRNRFVVRGDDGAARIVHNCGVAYSTDGGEVELPCQPRIDLVREIIEEAEAKVIVFVPYTGALRRLAAELAKEFTVEMIYGAVSKTERDRIFADFQKRTNPRVLVADARTMSHGLNLTAANTIVWFGPTTSNDTYGQANERIPRPGQKLDTNIIHIESSPIEAKMYDRLRKKSSLQGTLLEMLKGA